MLKISLRNFPAIKTYLYHVNLIPFKYSNLFGNKNTYEGKGLYIHNYMLEASITDKSMHIYK